MDPRSFTIADRRVGPGEPCLTIAEITQAHDGNLNFAHAYIDAAAAAGADVVKFQTHIAEAESTPAEPFRVPFSRLDKSRYDYWRRMEFTLPQWQGLAQHASECGLIFLSSPFSLEAVRLLLDVGIPAWKIGAGEVTNVPMLQAIAATNLPVLMSTGMSTWAEIETAVKLLREDACPLAMLQCTSRYPCPPEQLGLNVLDELRERFDCIVGLSDHSGTIAAGLAAVTLGANILEVHLTMSPHSFGPDTRVSLTVEQFRELVSGIRFIETALANPVQKDAAAGELEQLRKTFTKSIVALRDLPAGHRIQDNDLACKKPGQGIPPARWRELVGRTLARDVAANAILTEKDFD